jgi:glycosyltransferase involved in cell wall biosynthesis
LIRAYRYHAGGNGRPLPQEKVAAWLGVTQPQLSRIETGPPVTDLNRLIPWANTLGIPSELLWFRADDPDDEPRAAAGTRPATGEPRSRSVVLSVEPGRDGGASAGVLRSPPVGRAEPVDRVAGGSVTGSLRVGIIAPPWLPVPPPMYGGIELVIDALARGLAQRGHDIVLFATGDSTCTVKRAWVYDRSIPSGIGTTAIELNHAAAAYDALAGCDIIHDSTLAGLFIGQLRSGQPIVTTNHGPFAPILADVYRRTASAVPLVAISADQASRAPADIPIAAVIHHGLDLARYRFRPTPGDFYACLGRMHPDKGIDQAIKVARAAGVRLKIAAKMREPAEQRYFVDVIEPLLGRGIEYIGEADHETKIELLGGARALLNLVRWPEPFGLVTIEALACGTPVIATPCGAAPELVEHNTTGYIATTAADLVAAVAAVERLDRRGCRLQADQRFSMERMADRHDTLYRAVIGHWEQPSPP